MLEAFYSFASAALEIEPKEKFDRQSKNHSARENYCTPQPSWAPVNICVFLQEKSNKSMREKRFAHADFLTGMFFKKTNILQKPSMLKNQEFWKNNAKCDTKMTKQFSYQPTVKVMISGWAWTPIVILAICAKSKV